MLAKRVIPCMDVKDGRVVKGVNFVNLRDAGDPIELAQRYDEERADEVIFLDITATSDDRATTVDLASRASEQLHLPYCVGGGFRSVADIRTMIAAGADKVSVNSAAVADPSLITSAAAAFGSQAILCAIDAKQVTGNRQMGGHVAGGRKATGHRRGRLGAGGGPVRGGGRSCSPAWIATAAATASTARSLAPSRVRWTSRSSPRAGGQARALRPRRHRGRGRCRAGCKRLPLRRAFRPSSEGAYARPGYPRAAVGVGRPSFPERTRRRVARPRSSIASRGRTAEPSVQLKALRLAKKHRIRKFLAGSQARRRLFLRIEPGCWLAPFRSRAPHALETGDVFRIRWLFAIQNAVGRTGGGAIRFSDDPTAWFGIVPRTFTRRPSAFAGEKRGADAGCGCASSRSTSIE